MHISQIDYTEYNSDKRSHPEWLHMHVLLEQSEGLSVSECRQPHGRLSSHQKRPWGQFLRSWKFLVWNDIYIYIYLYLYIYIYIYISQNSWMIHFKISTFIFVKCSLAAQLIHVKYHVWNELPVQVRCTILDAWG